MNRRWWLALPVVAAALACPTDIIDHGIVDDGGTADAGGDAGAGGCVTNADCPCGQACLPIDGGAATCTPHAPVPCTTTPPCVQHLGPNYVCIETFRDGGSCGLSCQPDGG